MTFMLELPRAHPFSFGFALGGVMLLGGALASPLVGQEAPVEVAPGTRVVASVPMPDAPSGAVPESYRVLLKADQVHSLSEGWQSLDWLGDDEGAVPVSLMVGSEIPAGHLDVGRVEFRFSLDGKSIEVEKPLAFDVAAHHDLDVVLSGAPLYAGPGESTEFEVQAVNRGNVTDTLSLEPDLPREWRATIEPDSPRSVEPGDRVAWNIRVRAPTTASPGAQRALPLKVVGMGDREERIAPRAHLLEPAGLISSVRHIPGTLFVGLSPSALEGGSTSRSLSYGYRGSGPLGRNTHASLYWRSSPSIEEGRALRGLVRGPRRRLTLERPEGHLELGDLRVPRESGLLAPGFGTGARVTIQSESGRFSEASYVRSGSLSGWDRGDHLAWAGGTTRRGGRAALHLSHFMSPDTTTSRPSVTQIALHHSSEWRERHHVRALLGGLRGHAASSEQPRWGGTAHGAYAYRGEQGRFHVEGARVSEPFRGLGHLRDLGRLGLARTFMSALTVSADVDLQRFGRPLGSESVFGGVSEPRSRGGRLRVTYAPSRQLSLRPSLRFRRLSGTGVGVGLDQDLRVGSLDVTGRRGPLRLDLLYEQGENRRAGDVFRHQIARASLSLLGSSTQLQASFRHRSLPGASDRRSLSLRGGWRDRDRVNLEGGGTVHLTEAPSSRATAWGQARLRMGTNWELLLGGRYRDGSSRLPGMGWKFGIGVSRSFDMPTPVPMPDPVEGRVRYRPPGATHDEPYDGLALSLDQMTVTSDADGSFAFPRRYPHEAEEVVADPATFPDGARLAPGYDHEVDGDPIVVDLVATYAVDIRLELKGDDTPAEDHLVVLTHDGEREFIGRSNSRGRVHFGTVFPGTYEAEIYPPGTVLDEDPVQTEPVHVEDADVTQRITIPAEERDIDFSRPLPSLNDP